MPETLVGEPGRCVLCGHEPLRAFGMALDIRQALHVAQWECPACRLLTSHPRASADALARYYADNYYEHIWTDPDAVWRQNLVVYGKEMDLLDELVGIPGPGERALEVGSGYGVLLHLLGARGYQAHGCETGRSAVEFCRERGLNVMRAVAPELPFGSGSFQLVVSFHVIEHVLDPRAFVSALVRVLAPGGKLVLVTDHRWTTHALVTRLAASLCGRVPPFLTSTDHTYVFAREHVTGLMEASGCEDIKAVAYAHTPRGDSLHWRAYKGTFRALDRLRGWGDYMMVVGVKQRDPALARAV